MRHTTQAQCHASSLCLWGQVRERESERERERERERKRERERERKRERERERERERDCVCEGKRLCECERKNVLGENKREKVCACVKRSNLKYLFPPLTPHSPRVCVGVLVVRTLLAGPRPKQSRILTHSETG